MKAALAKSSAPAQRGKPGKAAPAATPGRKDAGRQMNGRCAMRLTVAALAFVLNTRDEQVVRWLPHVPTLPVTGGRSATATGLAAAGSLLLLRGLAMHRRSARYPARWSTDVACD